VGDLEIAGYRPARKVERAVESCLRWEFQVGDSAFELQAQPKVFGFYGGIFQTVKRDMCVAAVGGENDGAENIGFVLDGKNARR